MQQQLQAIATDMTWQEPQLTLCVAWHAQEGGGNASGTAGAGQRAGRRRAPAAAGQYRRRIRGGGARRARARTAGARLARACPTCCRTRPGGARCRCAARKPWPVTLESVPDLARACRRVAACSGTWRALRAGAVTRLYSFTS